VGTDEYPVARRTVAPWSPDADGANAAWLQTQQWGLPSDLQEFLHVISGGDQTKAGQRAALRAFLSNALAPAMPETLRAALHAADLWPAGKRQGHGLDHPGG
jgi:hypothetical protein